MLKRIISAVLSVVLIFGILPVHIFAAEPNYSLDNGYIKVDVSPENGGFMISTVKGNKLIKSDDNSDLLYRSGKYDTSFTSFRVEKNGVVKDYLFGGSYGGASKVKLTQASDQIRAEWSVDGITFTQIIALANEGSAEHGMVTLSYNVDNRSDSDCTIKARVLYDSAVEGQDYLYYKLIDGDRNTQTITTETVIEKNIPTSFFGMDSLEIPSYTTYSVNATAPYKLAIAHWNSLASTLFDFSPNSAINFTNAMNLQYMTADSAYALYYDLTSVKKNTSTMFTTNYGVYSNQKVTTAQSIAINASAPTALELSADKNTYVKDETAKNDATFGVSVNLENFVSDTSKDYSSITLALYCANGITPLDSVGMNLGYTPTFETPYSIVYSEFKQGKTMTSTLYFRADVGATASYRKIELRAFDTSVNEGLSEQNTVGTFTFYVLCPGGNGNLPTITFTNTDPSIIYYNGTRHVFITGDNLNLLYVQSRYTLYAYHKTESNVKYVIPSEQITFPDGEDGNVIDITLIESMKVGDYYFAFELTEEAANDLSVPRTVTGKALSFTISDKIEYKTDCYGVVAVVKKGDYLDAKYDIKTYASETKYLEDTKKYDDVLLTFRGEFVAEVKNGNIPTRLKAVSLKSSEGVVSNTITLNNCIDIEDGNVTVYYENNNNDSGTICIDFDAKLMTSVARTPVWTGYAALTSIKNGDEYGLIPYNKNGMRITGYQKNTITLIWPSAASLAQTVAGMLFNLAYGEMGIMYDTTITNYVNFSEDMPVLGRILTFSAKLDLGFIVPKGNKSKGEKAWDAMVERFSVTDQNGVALRDRWNGLAITSSLVDSDMSKKSADPPEGQFEVMVNNIIYGCGVGFVGVNFNVNLTLPPYFDGMPTISGMLSVNTIGDWSFGVEGMCKFATIELSVKLGIKSYNNIPIPDELYFSISGFEPGINVDGLGVVWITGAGGGISGLYDTIFCKSGIPPLKIMLSLSLDVLKVFSANGNIEVGLRGIALSVTNVKIKNTPVVVFQRINLRADWYPNMFLMAGVKASIFDIISGSGYIVVLKNDKYPNGFVEFYITAGVSLPNNIPIIGGMEAGRVGMGVNNQKIWGSIDIIGITAGITYYWGGEFDFGIGKSISPTFPELLGIKNDIPVYYDEATGDTLYMHIGTNFKVGAQASIVKDINTSSLMESCAPEIKSDETKKNHTLNLGDYSGESSVITLCFDANSYEEALSMINNEFVFSGLTYELYDKENDNASTANANLTYDSESLKATLAITVTDDTGYNKDYGITTSVAADVMMYSVANVASVNNASASINGDTIDLSWEGNELYQLDSMSFYLVDVNDSSDESGTFIGTIDDLNTIYSKSTSIEFPKTVKTGKYKLRVVYTDEDVVNSTYIDDKVIEYTNASQPDDIKSATLTNCGDNKFALDIVNQTSKDYDGYMVNVYEYDAQADVYNVVDAMSTAYEKENGVIPAITVGGSMIDTEGNNIGMTAGKEYRVGIIAYKNFTNADGNVISSVSSGEVFTEKALLRKPETPEISVSYKTASKSLTRTVGDEIQNVDTFASSDIKLSLDAKTQKVSGTLYVDAVENGKYTFTAKSDEITLSALADGDHTIEFTGSNENGDSFKFKQTFAVDTVAPSLIIESPKRGSLFGEDGKITVSGISDEYALFTVKIGDKTVIQSKTLEQLGGTADASGYFTFEVSGVDTASPLASFEIAAADECGNSKTYTASLVNEGYADIDSIAVYVSTDGGKTKLKLSDSNIITSKGDVDARLYLVAQTKTGTQFAINDSLLVSWQTTAVNGKASVDDNGNASIENGAKGYLVGSFTVGETEARTAALSFGSESFAQAPAEYTLTVNAQTGGTASVKTYKSVAGKQIKLSVTVESGYVFAGWESSVGEFTDASSAETYFIMPAGDVTVTAKMKKITGQSLYTLTEYEGIKIISGIREQTEYSVFVKNLAMGSITLYNGENKEVKAGELVATGMTVTLESVKYYLVIKGDTDGNGTVNSTDYLQIKRHFLHTNNIIGAFKPAADTDDTGSIDSADYLRIKRYMLKTTDLYK